MIDTQTREVLARIHGAPEPTDVEGRPLANINLSALAIDAMGSRLFAARGTDNAVSIFDTDTLDFVGAFPTAEYPTGLAMLPGQNRLLVTEGRGGGSGPSMGRRAKSVIAGSTTLVDLDTTDLTQSSAQVLANYAYPQTAFPFECEGRFPIPSRPNQRSPIKHVILLVKENKTFDCVFGDLEGPMQMLTPTWYATVARSPRTYTLWLNSTHCLIIFTPKSRILTSAISC